ncbi:MAG: imidazole glycerol phosphate synthase subunit HisF [Bacteroidia bacterium]
MLKKRVAATVVVKEGIAVQSILFQKYLPLGKPAIAIEFLNTWGIDEIILLDISASKRNAAPDYAMVKKAAEKCYVPLTVGGGITTLDHISELLHCGADKIALNQAALLYPELISEAAHVFGDQCIVVSIDAIKTKDGYRVYDYLEKKVLDITPQYFAKESIEKGAGEILINSVDRDGTYLGFDNDLINSVCAVATVPVICSGGAKNAADFIAVLSETKVSAATAANFFHFTEHSVTTTKANILKKVPVRLETHADYKESSFTNDFRLVKKSDEILEEMLFIRIEKEVI